MKRLIAALCLFLVSVTLVAASSYAWFSMNGVVKATDMQITAAVPSSLQISVTNESEGFIADVVLVNDSSMGVNIMPSVYATTPNALKELDFFVLTEAAMATVNENGVLGTIPGSSDSIEDIKVNDYYAATVADYFKDTMWLRYDGTASETISLNVKIEWDNTDVDVAIKNAFHIVFIDEDGEILIDYDMSDSSSAKALGLTLTSGADVGTKVTVYGYLSGNDEDCKNTTVSVNDTMKVKISFFGSED